MRQTQLQHCRAFELGAVPCVLLSRDLLLCRPGGVEPSQLTTLAAARSACSERIANATALGHAAELLHDYRALNFRELRQLEWLTSLEQRSGARRRARP